MPRLEVSEVFASIQGEGYWTGTPMVFVRFYGCNLACPFCDTKYARDSSRAFRIVESGESLEVFVGEVVEIARKHTIPNLCITGGEPTIQDPLLMKEFVDHVFDLIYELGEEPRFFIETNGTKRVDWWREDMKGCDDWIVVSPKPSDPEAYKRDYNWANEIKLVLEPQQEIPYFVCSVPDIRTLMPQTKRPFRENWDYNIMSYEWCAEQVISSRGMWRMSGRLQELMSRWR